MNKSSVAFSLLVLCVIATTAFAQEKNLPSNQAFCPIPQGDVARKAPVLSPARAAFLRMASAISLSPEAHDEQTAGAILQTIGGTCRQLRKNEESVSPMAPGQGAIHTNNVTLPKNLPGFAAEPETVDDAAENAGPLVEVMQLLLLGKEQEAIVILLPYTDENPDDSDGWRLLGDCRFRLGETTEALTAYENALRTGSTNYHALRGKAQCHLRLATVAWNDNNHNEAHKQYRAAQLAFLKCLQRQPADGDARYGHALSAEGLTRRLLPLAMRGINGEHHDDAKEVVRSCLDIIDNAIRVSRVRLVKTPDDCVARMVLANLYVKRGKLLQPFGHIDEACEDLGLAAAQFEKITKSEEVDLQALASQRMLTCKSLIKSWKTEQ